MRLIFLSWVLIEKGNCRWQLIEIGFLDVRGIYATASQESKLKGTVFRGLCLFYDIKISYGCSTDNVKTRLLCAGMEWGKV